jgi:hypothetical protein
MTKHFAVTAALASFLMTAVLPRPARADQWDKRTILTVNAPVQVPGAVLQPGTYVMKLVESPSNRHIVQIFNEKDDQLQTTILAIPNYRLQPTGDTQFSWWEVPAGQPRAMRGWFYPGDNFGQEFAYPEKTAAQIAGLNNANVPTTTAENESDMSNATVRSMNRSGAQEDLDRSTYERSTPPTAVHGEAQNQTDQAAQAAAVAPHPVQPAPEPPAAQTEPMQSAQNRSAQPKPEPTAPVQPSPAKVPEEGTRSRSLPASGSPYPLFGLAGIGALAAGLLVRRAAKANS